MSGTIDPITTAQGLRILERDLYRCVACGRILEGRRGTRWDLHLRIPRPDYRQPADPRTTADSNLVALCGRSQTATKCHGLVREYPGVARERGLTLWRSDSPWLVPVWVWAEPGRGHLLDEGATAYLLDDDGARETPAMRAAREREAERARLLGVSA